MSDVRTAVGRPLRSSSDFHGWPKIFYIIPKPVYRRDHCHHKPVCQLEIFSSCLARLETKLTILSLLHHYEVSQRSAQYKILNTTEHEL
jgi:hypothetical protein